MEKAVLVGLDLNNNIEYKMEELKNLAEACCIETVFIIIQKANEINNAFYVGSGKVKEIKMACNTYDADIVIFNNELSPAQIRNLENELDIKVIDRSLLILDIFAKRANTKESILEVELAQLRYMLPRLQGLRKSLSRQGGGFNAKGPGEKKIELDRRHIEGEISKLKNEIAKINRSKETQKRRRLNENIPLVALVGYTNAGKSATMNTILSKYMNSEEKLVYEENMLFATLNTSVRRVKLKSNQEFLLSDTVGFVSDLPHHLVNSFKSTLNEVLDATLLLHIVDISNPFYKSQIDTTNEVLASLGADHINTIYVFTKSDKLTEEFFPPYPNSILISNKNLENIDLLMNTIKDTLYPDNEILDLFIPYEKASLLSILERKACIYKKSHNDLGTIVKVEIGHELLSQFYPYHIDNN